MERSRSGCCRCKRRRQKCDEDKPSCGRCSEARTSCEYSIKLKWKGRNFDRSRFGACLKNVTRIGQLQRLIVAWQSNPIPSQSYAQLKLGKPKTLFGASSTLNRSISNGASTIKLRIQQLTLQPEDMTGGFVYAASAKRVSASMNEGCALLPDLDTLPSLSRIEKSLLVHFANEASRVTCCHANIQSELCHLIIPMATEVPSLMYASLAWSAIHSMAFGRQLDSVSDPQGLIATLKSRSIEHLRQEIQNPEKGQMDALLATVRTLCQCEIVNLGSDDDSVWRVHLKGAKALLNAIKRSNSSRCSKSRLLCRWYAAMESLASLTVRNPAPTCQALSEEMPESVYLDDYNGYSTDLSFVMGKIGSTSEAQADGLESAVYHIMERDNNQTPVFYPGVAEKLSEQDIWEYSLCNQAYQHTALIHIRRRLRNYASNHFLVQESVKQIIECALAITPRYGLSPAISLTTPLFTAGYEALGEDRATIRRLLSELYDKLKIRNIGFALELLEDHWSDEGGDGNRKKSLGWYYFYTVWSELIIYREEELGFHPVLNSVGEVAITSTKSHQAN